VAGAPAGGSSVAQTSNGGGATGNSSGASGASAKASGQQAQSATSSGPGTIASTPRAQTSVTSLGSAGMWFGVLLLLVGLSGLCTVLVQAARR
jgi:hypothetical protein